MDFTLSPEVEELRLRTRAFVDTHVLPLEADPKNFSDHENIPHDRLEPVREKAKKAGLWAPQSPKEYGGMDLPMVAWAVMYEEAARSLFGPLAMNCMAPDDGNMNVLKKLGTQKQKDKWLKPIVEGKVRSAFAMTEPAVASSDATNIEARIEREGDHYRINGRKWWTSGANDPRCKILIFMGKTDPQNPDRHRQQSMILVPVDTPGVKVLRHLPVFGYDDAPHGHAEVSFENVKVPAANILLGEGRGFEIAQGRLGPGRIHHCMRTIGRAERALEDMCRRAGSRVAFGRKLADQGVTRERIANSRILIDQARLLVLNAAWKMDKAGNKGAKQEIAMIKVVAPTMACQVIDWAMQVHGGAGVSEDFGLARAYAGIRTLRFADGPDEVHRNAIAKEELGKYGV